MTKQVRLIKSRTREKVTEELNEFLKDYDDNQIIDFIGFDRVGESAVMVVYLTPKSEEG